jgi:hypothetical protein
MAARADKDCIAVGGLAITSFKHSRFSRDSLHSAPLGSLIQDGKVNMQIPSGRCANIRRQSNPAFC